MNLQPEIPAAEPVSRHGEGKMPSLQPQAEISMAELASSHAIEDSRILVVDDDATTVAFIVKALQRVGYRGVTGLTDPRAIGTVMSPLPDLILLDLEMPALDGFSLMKQLEAWDWPHGLPLIIVITAHNERDRRLRALRAGAIDYIRKPLDLREIQLRVRNHLVNRILQQRLAASETRLSALLEQAEQGSRAKDLFLANISHELRTPLTAIIGFAESLAEDRTLGADQSERVDIVLRNVRHLHALVSDLLDISKLQVGHLHTERTQVQLFSCLCGVLRTIQGQAAGKGLRFRFHPIPPLPDVIQTDPTRFKQILINLLNNAVKFTEQGDVYLFLSWDSIHRQLVVTVQDSGPGIPRDALPTIFDPFTQADSSSGRQHGGSGLGLAIARGLAEQLGGSIEVSSHPDRGSVFIALIDTGPVADEHLIENIEDWQCEAGGFQEAVQVPVPDLRGHTLLVVEDTPDTRQLIALYLRRAGIRILTAANGEEAIQCVQHHADIDLVLMDMHMPDMDGLEATEILRLTGFDRPVIALTADVTKSTRTAAQAAGCDELLTKPIDLAAFYGMLARRLGGAAAEPSAPLASACGDVARAAPCAGGQTAPPAADDDAALEALRAEFARGLPERIAALRQAWERDDRASLRRQAHQLRGVGRSFGYPEVSELAATLEAAADRDGAAAIERCLHLLERSSCPPTSS